MDPSTPSTFAPDCGVGCACCLRAHSPSRPRSLSAVFFVGPLAPSATDPPKRVVLVLGGGSLGEIVATDPVALRCLVRSG